MATMWIVLPTMLDSALKRLRRMPTCQLPPRLPNDLGSFRDFLRTVAAEFNIDGADKLQAPDWRVML